jgi:hypothetical protein
LTILVAITTLNHIKSEKKNTRKADRNCISWVVIGTTIICTERSQQDLIIASIKRTIQLAVMQPPLARGHVLMEWPLFRGHVQDNDLFGGHVTKEQLKLVLMQPPLFRGHSELTITNLSGTGRWNYLDLDKLKHRKLSLVCLGFTSMNVPPMLKCPGPSTFRHNQMSGVAFGGHVPWVLCSVYLD